MTATPTAMTALTATGTLAVAEESYMRRSPKVAEVLPLLSTAGRNPITLLTDEATPRL